MDSSDFIDDDEHSREPTGSKSNKLIYKWWSIHGAPW